MDRRKMQELPEKSEWHNKTVAMLKEEAEGYVNYSITACKFSEYDEFKRTGVRNDVSYFVRRKMLASLAVACMYFDDERYISCLEDTIWAICDEFTWAVPAHTSWIEGGLSVHRNWIDIFAAETGFALSEISYLLDDKLSDTIKERIREEVHNRIILSFLNKPEYYWETILSNWASVCAGSVGMAFMYQASKEEIGKALPRLLAAMNVFLKSYGEDGACKEGVGYWGYGFSFFLIFAEKLRQYTKNEIDLLDNPKVKNIALFRQKVMLKRNRVANFSDCSSTCKYRIGITHFLAKEYEGMTVPSEKYQADFHSDSCYRWGIIIRDFWWAGLDVECQEKTEKYYYLPDAEWYINTSEVYAFAAKSGCNDEPHNHNDVGSFIFISGDEDMISELGMGEYTKAYFDDRRYEILTNGSHGHSVPIVNNVCQSAGKQFAGKLISQSKDEFIIDIAGAYCLDSLKSIKRSFKMKENSVELQDDYMIKGEDRMITERFMTYTKPVVEGNTVIIGSGRIIFEQDKFDCVIAPEEYSDPRGEKVNVYRVDFNAKNPAPEFSAKFIFQTNETASP